MLVVPAALALRWGVLGPLSYLFPPLRRLVVERASSLVINPTYRRRQLKDGEAWEWALQEGLAALVVWGAVGAVAVGGFPCSGYSAGTSSRRRSYFSTMRARSLRIVTTTRTGLQSIASRSSWTRSI
jgi:hypothetical protein